MNRRYDIDWLRVIAIGLLLVYHTAIAFQPWGILLGFITNRQFMPGLWIPMTMLNVWRIPLLFFISGMGVYFASQRRSWKQLLQERARRILLPCMFGVFVLVPLQVLIVQDYYQQPLSYVSTSAHLWFLGNIFMYVVLLLPLFMYVKNKEANKWVIGLKKILAHPVSLLVIVAAFVAEALLVRPVLYELYAMTWHGFFLGLLAFLSGFCLMLGGAPCWKMLLQWRWVFLIMAIALYGYRLLQIQMNVTPVQLAIESDCWIFAILAFGYKYLNFPGRTLRYLSEAAYPVYIIHMVCLYGASRLIFPLYINVLLQYVLVLLLTFTGCFILYECLVRRIRVLRILFGLKPGKIVVTDDRIMP